MPLRQVLHFHLVYFEVYFQHLNLLMSSHPILRDLQDPDHFQATEEVAVDPCCQSNLEDWCPLLNMVRKHLATV